MLVIRLKRIGKKNKPTYRVVVAEHSVAVNGSFVEDLGFYNPYSKELSINQDSALNWLNKGAKPSNTIARLLEKAKLKHKSIVVIQYNKAPKKKADEKATAVAKPANNEAPSDAVTTAEVDSTEPAETTPVEATDEVATVDETPAESPEESSPETPAEEDKESV